MSGEAESFARDGYLLLRGALPAALCVDYGAQVLAEYERLIAAGWRFAESGARSGHLNLRMGAPGRVLLAAVQEAGLPALVAQLAGGPVMLAQAGGNLNLPGSILQDYHIDGAFDARLTILNVCLVPTDASNGATQLVPASDATRLSYWRFVRDGWAARAVRPALQPGDVIIRPTNLWHRGTPNHSARPRPMAGLIWAPQPPGTAAPVVSELDGPPTLYANKYFGRWRRAKEFTAVRLPWCDHALRLVVSGLRDRG